MLYTIGYTDLYNQYYNDYGIDFKKRGRSDGYSGGSVFLHYQDADNAIKTIQNTQYGVLKLQ